MNSKTSNDKIINRIFVIMLIAIFVILALVVLGEVFKPFATKKLTQLPKTTIEECLTKKVTSKYYCLMYDPNDSDNEQINKVVVEYYQARKADDTLNAIFIIDYTKEDPAVVKELLEKVESVDNMPYMFLVSSGAVSTKYDTSSKICNVLLKDMGK